MDECCKEMERRCKEDVCSTSNSTFLILFIAFRGSGHQLFMGVLVYAVLYENVVSTQIITEAFLLRVCDVRKFFFFFLNG